MALIGLLIASDSKKHSTAIDKGLKKFQAVLSLRVPST